MKSLTEEGRNKLRAQIEMFKVLHEVYLLHKENERLQTKHGELNVFLQQRTVDGWGEHVIDAAMTHIQKQEKEIERLREALGYYADSENYANLMHNEAPIGFDEGERAREALRGEPN